MLELSLTLLLVAAEPAGTLTGVVLDTAGKPLAGAKVSISGTTTSSTISGANGAFGFKNVVPGGVIVHAQAPGMRFGDTNAFVPADTKVSVTLRGEQPGCKLNVKVSLSDGRPVDKPQVHAAKGDYRSFAAFPLKKSVEGTPLDSVSGGWHAESLPPLPNGLYTLLVEFAGTKGRIYSHVQRVNVKCDDAMDLDLKLPAKVEVRQSGH